YNISPFEAGYGWAVKLDKEFFIGKSAMEKIAKTWHGLPARGNTANPQDALRRMAVPQELLALQKDLDDLLAQAGYPKEEREFSAHLTLCRVNHPIAGLKMGEAIAQFSHLKLGSIAADALCVYQSQLTPAGPNYTLLDKFKLR
ncbi:MAG: hypothetical protein IMZ61_00565, partial [Planctomycetes bacterium]|nr:hypothetical protein [Planctomycetota bacterium]